MNREETSLISEKPDFARILDYLQAESSFGQDNAITLRMLANSIKPMEEEKKEAIPTQGPNCLVDCLWQEIDRIQTSNKEINQTIKHLQRVIGC